MMFPKNVPLIDGLRIDQAHKGGKGAAVVAPQPQITPPPPTEEASVAVEDTGMKKKVTQGKAELKIPLATAPDTGLKV